MRNADKWQPTKFVTTNGLMVGSRNGSDLAVSSRHVARLMGRPALSLQKHGGGSVFDLGCGRVPLCARSRGAASSVVCVDWPASLHEQKHVDVFCDVGRRLPFRDATADTVISSDVLEHLPEPGVTFEKLARVLAPGGRLMVNTPFFYRVHGEPHDFLRHTRYSLERHTRMAGLEVIEVVAVGGILDVLTDLLAKSFEGVPVAGRWLASAVQRLAGWLGSTSVGRRTQESSSAMFPLCHVLVARKSGGRVD